MEVPVVLVLVTLVLVTVCEVVVYVGVTPHGKALCGTVSEIC